MKTHVSRPGYTSPPYTDTNSKRLPDAREDLHTTLRNGEKYKQTDLEL